MRKLIALALVATAPVLLAGDGNSASATATASVNLYAPISLTKVSDVNFGVFILDGEKTITMANNGTISGGTKYGGTQLADITTAKAGHFTWTKDPNLDVTVKVEGTAVSGLAYSIPTKLNLGTGIDWTIKADLTSPSASTGDLVLYGDLAIGTGALTGTYSKTFTVNLAYN